MRIFAIALALGAVLGSATMSHAQTMKLCHTPFAPQIFAENGVTKGPWAEQIILVAKGAGYEITPTELPANRMVAALESGECDTALGILALFSEKKEAVVPANELFATIVMQVYAIGQDPAVKQPSDLSGKSVILTRGYSYGGWRKFIEDTANKVTVAIEVSDAELALRSLKAGRAPLMLQYQANIDLALQKEPVPDLRRTSLQVVPMHMLASAKRPDAQTIMTKFEVAAKKLRAEGKLSTLTQPAS